MSIFRVGRTRTVIKGEDLSEWWLRCGLMQPVHCHYPPFMLTATLKVHNTTFWSQYIARKLANALFLSVISSFYNPGPRAMSFPITFKLFASPHHFATLALLILNSQLSKYKTNWSVRCRQPSSPFNSNEIYHSQRKQVLVSPWHIYNSFDSEYCTWSCLHLTMLLFWLMT